MKQAGWARERAGCYGERADGTDQRRATEMKSASDERIARMQLETARINRERHVYQRRGGSTGSQRGGRRARVNSRLNASSGKSWPRRLHGLLVRGSRLRREIGARSVTTNDEAKPLKPSGLRSIGVYAAVAFA